MACWVAFAMACIPAAWVRKGIPVVAEGAQAAGDAVAAGPEFGFVGMTHRVVEYSGYT